MESRMHLALKRASAAFLREHGCRVVAAEVSCPFGRYRVDVAGYADTIGGRQEGLESGAPRSGVRAAPGRRCAPRTVFIECKANRSDFRRDALDHAPLEELRDHLARVRDTILSRAREADWAEVRQSGDRAASRCAQGVGDTLFAELATSEDALLRSRSYRSVLRRLHAAERRMHGATKFATLLRYRLADRLYIAAPQGMLRPRDLPDGWGLLEAPRSTLEEGDPSADLFGRTVLSVRVRAQPLDSRETYRLRVLRNIAVAASAVCAREFGLRT